MNSTLRLSLLYLTALIVVQALRLGRLSSRPLIISRGGGSRLAATRQDDRPPSRILELINNTASPSTLLTDEAAIYGVLTAISEQHLLMGSADLAMSSAFDAIAIARHSGEENNVYYAYAEGLLAQAFEAKKEFEQAAEHYKKALVIYEKHYSGKNDPIELESVGYYQLISWFLLSQGRYHEAIATCQMALNAMEAVLGKDHVDTAATMVNLAAAQINTGDIGIAPEELLTRAMKVYRDSEVVARQQEQQSDSLGELSAAFPSVAFSMVSTLCNLGTLFFLRGDDEKAFDYYNQLYRMTLDDDLRDDPWPGLPKVSPDSYPESGSFGEMSSQFGLCLKNFGVLLLRRSKPFAARGVLLTARRFLENSRDFGPGHSITNKVQSLIEQAERKAISPDVEPDDGFWMF